MSLIEKFLNLFKHMKLDISILLPKPIQLIFMIVYLQPE